MERARVSGSYHRIVTVGLILLNAAAIAYAVSLGGPGKWDLHFRNQSVISWFSSAQMFGASLLFLACFFAGKVITAGEGKTPQKHHTWLVFAAGFFALALDQQFYIRDQLAAWIDGVAPGIESQSHTPTIIKLVLTSMAIGLVVYFRTTVLANFRMVAAFLGGFWFLLLMLLIDVLFDNIGLPAWLAKTIQGSGKLLAMAMFLSGSYAALLEKLHAANAAAQLGLHGERRKRQLPINFPDRRARRREDAGAGRPTQPPALDAFGKPVSPDRPTVVPDADQADDASKASAVEAVKAASSEGGAPGEAPSEDKAPGEVPPEGQASPEATPDGGEAGDATGAPTPNKPTPDNPAKKGPGEKSTAETSAPTKEASAKKS